MRRSTLPILLLSLLFVVPRASAQDVAPPEAETPATTETTEAVVPEPPGSTEPTPTGSHDPAEVTAVAQPVLADPTPPDEQPAPPPAAAAPRFEAVVAGVPIRITGTLHAAIIGTQGVQSFGQPNASAATAALNPALHAHPSDAELTFQVQQTRLGLLVGEGTDFRGQLEIDFIHFDQSSPTTQAFPRIRIASLEWRVAEGHRLFIGQNWDLFGNATGSLLSHSSNLVGTLFQAGNIGFMRQQLGWIGAFGNVEIGLAAGLQGANTGPTFNDIEGSFTPTGSARVMIHLDDHSVIGVSGLGTAVQFTSMGMQERRLALGGEVFGDLTFGPLNLHAELYLAQNLANLGSLNLGQGRYGVDVADAGGYVSGKLTLGQHAITAMFGAAAVLNPDDVVPGYTPADPMGTSPNGTANVGAGPGMHYNLSAHLGYWYSPLPGLSIVAEPYVYVTRFALAPADAARFDRDRVAFGGQLTGMFQF